jgi:hypothetical protein
MWTGIEPSLFHGSFMTRSNTQITQRSTDLAMFSANVISTQFIGQQEGLQIIKRKAEDFISSCVRVHPYYRIM